MSDAASFSEIAAQREFLRRLARALLRDEHAAEDVAQDALLHALEAGPTALRSPRAWLARVVRRRSGRWKRREAQRAEREARAARPESIEERSDRELLLQQEVLEAVRALEPIYRSAIFLRYFEERTPPEIASALALPLATVKTRLQRGLARLREDLDRRHGGDRRAWLAPLATLGVPSAMGVPSLVGVELGSALLLLMKKFALAVAVLLAVGLGFWILRETPLDVAVEPPPELHLRSEPAGEKEQVQVARAGAAVVPDAPASEQTPAEQEVVETPPEALVEDGNPQGPMGSNAVTALQFPRGGDGFLNPSRRRFTSDELERIGAFAMEDAKLALELDREFHRRLNELGEQLLDQGRHDGSVDTRTLSAEEREKLPWLTKDWLNPIFVRWQGPQQTWIQIDLRTEAPDLARLREEGWQEQAAARRRLREFIQSLPK
ncbi:MAG: RNA polymerase sigma factor [Planctomycetes bacterium]|nr:RNA polymerase sigma factor [Planctomycetota bacterium]